MKILKDQNNTMINPETTSDKTNVDNDDVREKIKNLINKANSYNIPSKESITKKIEVVPKKPVTTQNFKIMDASSGKQISDVEMNQNKKGDKVFSVSKK